MPPWDWTGRGGTGLDRRGIVVVDASNSKEGVGLRKSRGGGGAIAGTGTGPKGFQVKVPAVLMLTHLSFHHSGYSQMRSCCLLILF